MKHDIIGRVLKILRVEKRPGNEGSSILVQPKLEYTEDISNAQPYSGLEIPHWAYIEAYFNNSGPGGGGSKSLIISAGPNIVIDWQNDLAPDDEGLPTTDTYFDIFRFAPTFQVWLEVSPGNFQIEAVPISMTMTGSDIDTVTIDTSGLAARIIII